MIKPNIEAALPPPSSPPLFIQEYVIDESPERRLTTPTDDMGEEPILAQPYQSIPMPDSPPPHSTHILSETDPQSPVQPLKRKSRKHKTHKHKTEPSKQITKPPTHTSEPPTSIPEHVKQITEPPTHTTEPPTHTSEPPTHTSEPPTHTSKKRDIAQLSEAEKLKLMKRQTKRQKTHHQTKSPALQQQIITTQPPHSTEEQTQPQPATTSQKTPHTSPTQTRTTMGSDNTTTPPESQHQFENQTRPIPEATTSSTDPEPNSFFYPGPQRNFPFPLFDNFIIPTDDKIFSNHTYRELILSTAFHGGQCLASFSRLLRQERDPPNSDTIYRGLRRRLEIAEKDRDRLAIEHFDAQNLSSVYLQELTEANKTNEESQKLLREANQRIESLEEAQRVEEAEHLRLEKLNAEQLQQLQIDNTTAEEKIKELNAELHQIQPRIDHLEEQNSKHIAELQQAEEAKSEVNNLLAQHEATIQQLQMENQQLQTQLRTSQISIQELETRPPSSDQRTQIIAEYRASPELVQEIIEEFGKGYQAAMSKVEAAGIDPKTIDPSDDEDEEN